MFIRVSTQASMWGFGNIWLTFADKRPLELDLVNLDSNTYTMVQKALQQGVLVEVDCNGNPIKKKAIIEQRPVIQIDTFLTDIPLHLAEKVKTLLDNGVTTLRREIALIKHSPTLSAALKIEKEGKNRKTVIAMLEKQVGICGNVRTMYDDLIHDEEESDKIITLKLESMSLISSEEDISSPVI